MTKPACDLRGFAAYTTRIFLKVILFIGLFCLGAMIINPEIFISLETSERFAIWIYGFVSQENFDEFWVLTWMVCSLLTAIVGYLMAMKLIKILRRK